MSTFRYTLDGRWFKGNTHIHSTVSDGGMDFAELEQLYSLAGYDFLFRTDHWVASDVAVEQHAASLLWLDGVELDGIDGSGANYHVAALGRFYGIDPAMGMQAALDTARAQGGMLILAHPQWMGNTFDEAVRGHFDGVEVYNHICHWLNGKGDGGAYWNAMLGVYPNTLAFAVDDAHLNPSDPGWNGGWIMVNAPQCEAEAILGAIRAGNFYSSCGPEIYDLRYDGEQVSVDCSPVQFARLVGPAWCGDRVGSFTHNLLTHAVFKVPPYWPYAYLELEDPQGRRAWTNPLFVASASSIS